MYHWNHALYLPSYRFHLRVEKSITIDWLGSDNGYQWTAQLLTTLENADPADILTTIFCTLKLYKQGMELSVGVKRRGSIAQ